MKRARFVRVVSLSEATAAACVATRLFHVGVHRRRRGRGRRYRGGLHRCSWVVRAEEALPAAGALRPVHGLGGDSGGSELKRRQRRRCRCSCWLDRLLLGVPAASAARDVHKEGEVVAALAAARPLLGAVVEDGRGGVEATRLGLVAFLAVTSRAADALAQQQRRHGRPCHLRSGMRLAAGAAFATVASRAKPVHPRRMHVTPFRLGRKRASAPIEELVAAADEPDVEPASEQGDPTRPAGPASEAAVQSRELQDEGNALAESQGDFSGALKLWLRAVALTPHRPELHETLVRHSARRMSLASLTAL